MALSSHELYDLFLTLAPARIGLARSALAMSGAARSRELAAALVPLAVDALLLGAEGVGVLARAVVLGQGSDEQFQAALDTLEDAARALGKGDASGARVDEAQLLEMARGFTSGDVPARTGSFPPSAFASLPPEESAGTREDSSEDDESRWSPELAEDMISAFLDECVERTDALSERLLALEQRGPEPSLIDELFRDLHTLKGSSAFAGLRKMNRVAHRAEDLIGELRDGKRSCDRALIDVLLETLDVLRAIVDRARKRAPIDIDVSDLLRRLKSPHSAPSIRPGAPGKGAELAGGSLELSAFSAGSTQQSTLRIEFEKVDRLLNLVGEIVLSRGKLTSTTETQAALIREVSSLRRKLNAALGGSPLDGVLGIVASDARSSLPRRASSTLLEDLERTERVLRETFGEMDLGLGSLTLAVGQLRDTVMKLRMVPIARLFAKYQRTVRELSNKLGKEARVELVGAETELDKVLVERLEDPLLHLVRNAIDHGLESTGEREALAKPPVGLVRLSASQRGGQIVVAIEDDGRGLDPRKLREKAVSRGILNHEEAAELSDEQSFDLIFRAGFSTKDTVSDVSGRGVGMDVVRDAIQKLKGTIQIRSEVGKGTRIELGLPLTLAITQVLTARVGGELIAIPLDAVVSAQTLGPGQLEPIATGFCIRVGSALIPVVDLADVLGLSADAGLGELGERNVVIVRIGTTELGLIVQQVLGRHEVVIKSLGPMLVNAPCAAGAAVIGDRMVLVVDLADVGARAHSPQPNVVQVRPRLRTNARARVLVAEDSPWIREAIRRELTDAGYEVTLAEDGERALELSREQVFDAVTTDVMMPRRDGYELTRALRADPRYHDVPIVMVTSKDARIDAVRGYDAGANAYINKPADVEELIRALESLLRRRGG